MIAVSAWMIRAALLYLGIGFTFGALMLVNKGIPLDPSLWRLLNIHVEFLLIGWTLQLAMGVAAWILPRFSAEPRYGALGLMWAAFALLNTGVLCVAAGSWAGEPLTRLILAGRALELLAAVSFVAHIWRRVKPLALSSAP